MKYVKNAALTASIYLGITLEPNEVRSIVKSEEALWQTDADVQAAIASGDLIVSSDGTNFISGNAALVMFNAEGTLDTYYVSSTSVVSTSSTTMALVGSMTVTPPAGSYLIFFGAKANTSGVNAQSEYGIYVGGTLVPETKRELSCSLTLLGVITVSLNTIGVEARTSSRISVDGTQTVEIKFRSVNGVAVSFGERSLTLVRVG